MRQRFVYDGMPLQPGEQWAASELFRTAVAVRMRFGIRNGKPWCELVPPNRRLQTKRRIRNEIWLRRIIRTHYGVSELVAAMSIDYQRQAHMAKAIGYHGTSPVSEASGSAQSAAQEKNSQ